MILPVHVIVTVAPTFGTFGTLNPPPVLVCVPTNQQAPTQKNPVQINEQDLYLFFGFVSPRGTKAQRNTKEESLMLTLLEP